MVSVRPKRHQGKGSPKGLVTEHQATGDPPAGTVVHLWATGERAPGGTSGLLCCKSHLQDTFTNRPSVEYTLGHCFSF